MSAPTFQTLERLPNMHNDLASTTRMVRFVMFLPVVMTKPMRLHAIVPDASALSDDVCE